MEFFILTQAPRNLKAKINPSTRQLCVWGEHDRQVYMLNAATLSVFHHSIYGSMPVLRSLIM